VSSGLTALRTCDVCQNVHLARHTGIKLWVPPTHEGRQARQPTIKPTVLLQSPAESAADFGHWAQVILYRAAAAAAG
jgi:hypothetical protein